VQDADAAKAEARLLARLGCVIRRSLDVQKLHFLKRLPCGRCVYLIETPYMTFPRFAVGTTNDANDDVRLISTHGALWSAEESFEAVCQPGGAVG